MKITPEGGGTTTLREELPVAILPARENKLGSVGVCHSLTSHCAYA